MKPSPNEGLEVDISRTKYKTSKEALQAAGLIFKNFPTEAPKADFPSRVCPVFDPKIHKESDYPDFVWIDGFVTRDEALSYAPWQRINKIPGMDYICYKSTLFIELNKMKKLFPEIYTQAYPTAFLLPNDFSEFQREHKRLVGLVTNVSSSNNHASSAPTWVVKPKNGCCGQGISLIQSTYEASDISEQVVCQLYISPFIINQRKFDFRLYILVASLEPLTFFIYREGIARFCTDPYEPPSRSNRDKKFCHLTNTAINKENGTISDPCDFTKKFTEIMQIIIQKSPQKAKELYTKICDVSRAVILGVLPMMLGSIPRKDDLKPPVHAADRVLRASVPSLRNRSFSPDQKMKRKLFIPKPAQNSPPQAPKHHQRAAILEEIPPLMGSPPAKNESSVRNELTELSENPKESIENDGKNGNSESKSSITENESKNVNSESKSSIAGNESKSGNNENKSSDNRNGNNESRNSETKSSENRNSETDANGASYKPGKCWLKPSKRYFHILGIDVLLSESLEPFVLELNDRPSLSVTVPFEEELKVKMMRDAFFHVFPPSNPAPHPAENPPSEIPLVAPDCEESDWTQIFPLPEKPIRSGACGFTNSSFFGNEAWKEVLRRASVPAHPSSSVASANATNRMASSGISEALHQERRQRFNEIRESTKGNKFNLY